MNSDKLFIEYIITGSLSIIWIFPILLVISGGTVNDLGLNIEKILVAIPFTYIIGMLIDFISAYFLRGRKNILKKEIYDRHDLKPRRYHKVMVEAVGFNSELGKQLGMRISRVRISRGLLINLLFSLFSFPIYFLVIGNKYSAGISIVLIFVLVIIVWRMWRKMLKLSFHFQAYIIRYLEKEK